MAFTMKSAERLLELADFPDEILHKVFASLDTKNLLNCGKVAKRFRKIAHDKFLWQRTDLSQKNISTALIQFILDRGCKYLDLSNSLIIDTSYPIDFIIFKNCAELTELNLENANICLSKGNKLFGSKLNFKDEKNKSGKALYQRSRQAYQDWLKIVTNYKNLAYTIVLFLSLIVE